MVGKGEFVFVRRRKIEIIPDIILLEKLGISA